MKEDPPTAAESQRGAIPMADNDQKLAAPPRPEPPKGGEVSVGEPHAVGAPRSTTRRFDGPQIALTAIRIGPGLMLLAVVVLVASLSPVFLSTRNVGNVLSQSAVIAVLALAQLLVIITRGIDLSVGSTLALSAVVGAMVFSSTPSGPLVVVAMLATGALVGAVNGMVFVWGKLPHPFIITLATLSIARG